jgi:hypothetical protein
MRTCAIIHPLHLELETAVERKRLECSFDGHSGGTNQSVNLGSWGQEYGGWNRLFGMQSSIQSDQLCVLAVVNLKRRQIYWVGRE